MNAVRIFLMLTILLLLVAACGTAASVPMNSGEPPLLDMTPSSTSRPQATTPVHTPTPAHSPTSAALPSPTLAPTVAVPPTQIPTAVPTPTSSDFVILEERSIGPYTIRLWKPRSGVGMYNHATISATGQPEIRIESVATIGNLPAEDITGDRFPDVWFETYAGGSHCCWGTVVYNLGPVPEKVLDILSAAYYYGTGSGTFQDLDGDGIYEFITQDPLIGIPCSAPSVKAILRYMPGQGYVGASPRFASAYADDIAAYTRRAEEQIELSRDGYKCGVYEVMVSYLYAGLADRAWQELQRLYLGPDLEQFWAQLQQSVSEGRFYVPAATP